MLKNKRGITLIALVITIIILLILAGVSIATLVGDNGVLSKANTVKEENIHGDVSGSLMLEYGDYEIVSNTEGTSVTFLEYLISKEYVNEDTGIVNVAKTTGQEKILGNGSGDNDVYKLIEEDNHFVKEGEDYYRLSKVYKVTIDRKTNREVKKEIILDNHSKVMYDYKLIPKEQIRL